MRPPAETLHRAAARGGASRRQQKHTRWKIQGFVWQARGDRGRWATWQRVKPFLVSDGRAHCSMTSPAPNLAEVQAASLGWREHIRELPPGPQPSECKKKKKKTGVTYVPDNSSHLYKHPTSTTMKLNALLFLSGPFYADCNSSNMSNSYSHSNAALTQAG